MEQDWRSAAARRGLKVTDLAEHVGTRIDGIDLGDNHDAEMVAIIRAAVVERTLLLFRGQEKLSPAGYLGFASRFGGRPDLHSLRHYCLPDHHEIFVVGNVHEQDTKVGSAPVGSPRVGLNWHTDHYHLPEPGLFTYLHAIQVPKDQGDTRYANGIAAYEALPPEKRAEAFRPFVRLDNARNLDETGTGLGLAIALDIARAHGGDLRLEDSPKGGLRAVVQIPV